jgi:hypothetical protein
MLVESLAGLGFGERIYDVDIRPILAKFPNITRTINP